MERLGGFRRRGMRWSSVGKEHTCAWERASGSGLDDCSSMLRAHQAKMHGSRRGHFVAFEPFQTQKAKFGLAFGAADVVAASDSLRQPICTCRALLLIFAVLSGDDVAAPLYR